MSELNPCVSCGAHVPEAQAPPFPGHADDCALRTSWLSRPSYDDPETDGTDYAHPAWWRGNDAGVAGAVRIINEALDGPIPASGCVGGQELEVCRRRVEALRQENARLEALIVEQGDSGFVVTDELYAEANSIRSRAKGLTQ